MASDDENTTKSTRTRWEHTGTIMALMLLGTACTVALISVYRGDKTPLWVAGTLSLSAIAAVAWGFGEAALRAAAKAKGGGGE